MNVLLSFSMLAKTSLASLELIPEFLLPQLKCLSCLYTDQHRRIQTDNETDSHIFGVNARVLTATTKVFIMSVYSPIQTNTGRQ